MDILSRLAHAYWAWLASFSLEFQSLFIRWALILLVALLLGAIVRFRIAPRVRTTLPAQFAAAVIAVTVGLAVPLDELYRLDTDNLAQLLSLSLLCWVFLPLFLPSLLIRTRVTQVSARFALYSAEILLLFIQWAAMEG